MEIGNDAAVYVISVAAELAGMHPQTLRQYDRLGLVIPQRTSGRGRRYSVNDVDKLRLIQNLSQDEGINLAGIKRILELQDRISSLEATARTLDQRLRAVARSDDARRVFAAASSGDVVSMAAGQRIRKIPLAVTAGRRPVSDVVLYRGGRSTR